MKRSAKVSKVSKVSRITYESKSKSVKTSMPPLGLAKSMLLLKSYCAVSVKNLNRLDQLTLLSFMLNPPACSESDCCETTPALGAAAAWPFACGWITPFWPLKLFGWTGVIGVAGVGVAAVSVSALGVVPALRFAVDPFLVARYYQRQHFYKKSI